jgi:hypothetical protein
MAKQQQDQNRPGQDRESGQQPGKSPGQTIPGQGNQPPADQGKQNPRDQGKNPGMPQRDPASPASSPGTKGDPPYRQPGNYPDNPPPDVFAGEERPGRPIPQEDSGRRGNPDSIRPDSGGKSGNDSSQRRK